MSDEPVRSEEVFGLLRDLERSAPGKPRIGKALRAEDDIVRFGQVTHLVFAPTSLETDPKAPPSPIKFLRTYFMSLIGPMGPLPLQFSELAHFERRYSKSQPFGSFLDVIANRMIQLFFRAWADSEPMAQQDRPDHDLFQQYVGSLGAQADASAREAPSQLQLALLGFAGQTAAHRSPAAIADAAGALIGIETSVVEFVGAWSAIDRQDATRIGRQGQHNDLGQGAMLGLAVYTVQDTCLVRLHFTTLEDYERHLPDASGYGLASAVLEQLLPSHLDWRIEYELPRAETRHSRLDGSTRLGWTSWLGAQPDGPERRDLRLPAARAASAF